MSPYDIKLQGWGNGYRVCIIRYSFPGVRKSKFNTKVHTHLLHILIRPNNDNNTFPISINTEYKHVDVFRHFSATHLEIIIIFKCLYTYAKFSFKIHELALNIAQKGITDIFISEKSIKSMKFSGNYTRHWIWKKYFTTFVSVLYFYELKVCVLPQIYKELYIRKFMTKWKPTYPLKMV